MPEFQEIDEIVPLRPAAEPSVAPLPYSQPAPLRAAPTSGSGTPNGARSQPAAAQPGRASKRGVVGILATIGAALAKWWALALSLLLKFKALLIAAKLLTAGKLLLTFGTMLLSMFLWSYSFGWPMAVGIVLLIFFHECGHALAAHKLGHKLGIMLFVPFMGAVVSSRGGRSVTEGAFVGIMGPVAGACTAAACIALYVSTHFGLWLALAWVAFFLNLINLTPAPPLDGGWISPLFSPKLLLPGIVLAVVVFHANPFVWLLAIMSLPNTIHAWRHGKTSPYYQATNRDRWVYGSAYLGLIAFLASGLFVTSSLMRPHAIRKGARRTVVAAAHIHGRAGDGSIANG